MLFNSKCYFTFLCWKFDNDASKKKKKQKKKVKEEKAGEEPPEEVKSEGVNQISDGDKNDKKLSKQR